MFSNVGLKWMAIATTVLVVTSTFWGMILYTQKDAKDDLRQEIQVEQLETKIETLKRVEEKLDETDTIVTDADSARQWLLQRQRSNTD